ncbi:MAG: YsnF/AvaK domain-containing protein [Candidatus Xenobia bacterium]
MSDTLYVTFKCRPLAERAVGALLDHGLAESDLDPIGGAGQHLTTTTTADVAAGAVKGGILGLVFGTLIGLLSILVPGHGLVVAGGTLPMAIAAVGATTAAGAIAGGLIGYLVDQGVAGRATASEIHENAPVTLSVRIGKVPRDVVERVLQKYGGTWLETPRTSPLVPTVQETEASTVVDLVSEQLVVVRHPADRLARPEELHAFEAGTLEVLEMREEPVLQKRLRVVEEIVVRRELQHRLATLEDTVRRVEPQPGSCELPPSQPVVESRWASLLRSGKDIYVRKLLHRRA